MGPRGLPRRFAFFLPGKPVGKCAIIIGQDGMHFLRKHGQKFVYGLGDRLRVSPGQHFDPHIPRGAVNRDQGIARLLVQWAQDFQIQMNVPAGRCREPTHWRHIVGRGRQGRDALPDQAAVNRAPTQGRGTTAVHHLSDIVEGEPQLGAQFNDESFLLGGGAGMDLWRTCEPSWIQPARFHL